MQGHQAHYTTINLRFVFICSLGNDAINKYGVVISGSLGSVEIIKFGTAISESGRA